MLSFVRLMSLLEGSSLLVLLLIAIPLKHGLGMPEVVKVVGSIHGVLFLLFNTMLFTYAARGNLSGVKATLGLFASLVPFGAFVYKAKVLNQISLEEAKIKT